MAHAHATTSAPKHEVDEATIAVVLTALDALLTNSHSSQTDAASHDGSALASAHALHPPRPLTANSNAINTLKPGSLTVTRALSVATGVMPSSHIR